MIGAIAGDIIGSPYEARNVRTTDFPLFSAESRFTDDTVLTVAVADAILHERPYASALREYCRGYPNAGYGMSFFAWAMSDAQGPYGSWGNGSAMRVSPVGWAFDDLDAVLREARRSAEATHNHPEGVRGAEAVAAAVFLARTGGGREQIRSCLAERFGYDLGRSIEQIRPSHGFDLSCQSTVPVAARAFLESEDFEQAVRLAVSVGGDSDTIACIAGAIAGAFYGVPSEIRERARALLDGRLLAVVERFEDRFGRGCDGRADGRKTG